MPSHLHVRLPRSLAVAVAALALAAPAATARPIADATPGFSEQEVQMLASRGVGAPARPTRTSTPRTQSTATGFDWGSAGIGAAAAGGLVVVVAVSGFGAARRGRLRLAR
jgi:hypothetical protein